jgi:hypothetical protein
MFMYDYIYIYSFIYVLLLIPCVGTCEESELGGSVVPRDEATDLVGYSTHKQHTKHTQTQNRLEPRHINKQTHIQFRIKAHTQADTQTQLV